MSATPSDVDDALAALRRRGMTRDFSWERSARAYADLYATLAR